MKKQIVSLFLVFIFCIFPLQQSHAAEITLNNTPFQIYFSPKGGCTEAIVKEINQAKSEIYIQAGKAKT